MNTTPENSDEIVADKPKSALDLAIEAVGTQQTLAELLGIKSPSISEWHARGKVPTERCIAIEEATGGKVTRYDLRPDVFGPAPAAAEPAEKAA